jgi:hypothetical protein
MSRQLRGQIMFQRERSSRGASPPVGMPRSGRSSLASWQKRGGVRRCALLPVRLDVGAVDLLRAHAHVGTHGLIGSPSASTPSQAWRNQRLLALPDDLELYADGAEANANAAQLAQEHRADQRKSRILKASPPCLMRDPPRERG